MNKLLVLSLLLCSLAAYAGEAPVAPTIPEDCPYVITVLEDGSLMVWGIISHDPLIVTPMGRLPAPMAMPEGAQVVMPQPADQPQSPAEDAEPEKSTEAPAAPVAP